MKSKILIFILIYFLMSCSSTSTKNIEEIESKPIRYFASLTVKEGILPLEPRVEITEAEAANSISYLKAFYNESNQLIKIETYFNKENLEIIYYTYHENGKVKFYLTEYETGETYLIEYDEKGEVIKEELKE